MIKYDKRFSGRKFEEMRKMEAKAGIIKNADGSGFFKIGETTAIAAVFGPKELHPKFLQNPRAGKLRCNYNMGNFFRNPIMILYCNLRFSVWS